MKFSSLWSMLWHKVKFHKEATFLWSIVHKIVVAFNEWQGLVIGRLILGWHPHYLADALHA